MSPPILGYWDIRGLAQPIRLLLSYLDVKFEDKHYVCGPAPDFDRSDWFDAKANVDVPFQNLPYYIDGDVKLSQSLAIIKHIARKHGLDSKTDVEKRRIDVLDGVMGDIYTQFLMMCYVNFDGVRPGFLEALPGRMKDMSEFLGDRQWFAGEEITYIDFKLYELLTVLKAFSGNCLDELQNLNDFIARFEALPNIAKYMSSPNYIHKPINNKMAKFGAD